MLLTTLCYIEKDRKFLMLHRTKKDKDVNKDKWIGIGGKLEEDESPEEGIVREVKEETGLTLIDYRLRGLVTFVCSGWESEHMYLFTADKFSGDLSPCSEGELAWIDISAVQNLNIWEGDKLFLDMLEKETHFFSMKLVYDKDNLIHYAINGKHVR